MLLSELIDLAYFGERITYCNPDITPRHFPDEDIRDGLTLISLADLGLEHEDYFFAAPVLEAMMAQGWSPATMIELAHYASRAWDMVTRVVALGFPWISEENIRAAWQADEYVPVKFSGTLEPTDHGGRHLDLRDADKAPWSNRHRFLVIRIPSTH